MKVDLEKFFNSTPRVIDVAMALALSSLGLGFALSIGLSDNVRVNQNGLQIEKQAIANQKDLERSLLIINIQQSIIEQLRDETASFSRRYEAGTDLAEQAQHAAEVIPDEQISDLEQRIGKSRMVLEEPNRN